MSKMKTSSEASPHSPTDAEKSGVGAHIQPVHTNERVPGHTNYYEKDGLRRSSATLQFFQRNNIDIFGSKALSSKVKIMNVNHRYRIQPIDKELKLMKS